MLPIRIIPIVWFPNLVAIIFFLALCFQTCSAKMAVCSVCNVALIDSDKHSKCLLHRKCSRTKPCKLDAEYPQAYYWDEVETTLKANARKSRRAAQATVSRKPKSPPPLRNVARGDFGVQGDLGAYQNFTLNECILKHWSVGVCVCVCVCVCYEKVKVLFIIQTTLLHYSKVLFASEHRTKSVMP